MDNDSNHVFVNLNYILIFKNLPNKPGNLSWNKFSQQLSALCIVQEEKDYSEIIYKLTIWALPSSTELVFTCSKLTIKTLKQDVKYVQS